MYLGEGRGNLGEEWPTLLKGQGEGKVCTGGAAQRGSEDFCRWMRGVSTFQEEVTGKL